MEKRGYILIPTTGLFKYKTRATTFVFCVDDFGIKYNNDDDIQHLIDTLQEYYDILIDRSGRHYCGLTFTWNYQQGYVDVAMPNYVMKALAKFGHPKPTRAQNAPHR